MKGGKKGKDTSLLLSIGSDCLLLFSILFTCDSHLQYFNVNQIQREIMCELSKIVHLQENLKVLSQEVAEWTEPMWEGRE